MAIGTTAAILGAGILGAGSSVASGLLGADAAKDAAKAQEQAALQSLALQGQIYNQTRSDFEPYRQFGLGAAPLLAGLLGFNYDQNASSPSQVQTSFGPTFGNAGLNSGSINAGAYYERYPAVLEAFNSLGEEDLKYLQEQGYSPSYGGFAQYHYDTYGNHLPEYAVKGYPTQEAYDKAVANGTTNGGTQGGATGVGGSASNSIDRQAYLESTPGYQFALNQALGSVDAAAANSGLINSGARAKALQENAAGLASQTYQQNVNNLFNALNVGTGAGAQVAGAGANYAAGGSQALQYGANANAAGQYNRASAFGNAIGGFAGNVGGILGGLAAFGNQPNAYGGTGTPSGYGGGFGGVHSDARLKDNLKPIGTYKGLTLYEWNWNETAKMLGVDSEPQFGLLAQEVQAKFPDAVSKDEHGFLVINYGAL